MAAALSGPPTALLPMLPSYLQRHPLRSFFVLGDSLGEAPDAGAADPAPLLSLSLPAASPHSAPVSAAATSSGPTPQPLLEELDGAESPHGEHSGETPRAATAEDGSALLSPPSADDRSQAFPGLPRCPKSFEWSPLRLPSVWNTEDHHQFLKVQHGNLSVSYSGSARSSSDSAMIRAEHPIPFQVGIYYYENTILSKGREGFIGVGFCGPDCSHQKLPGWDTNSFGYHGDDGQKFRSDPRGKPFGPLFAVGDVIGCGVDFISRSIFFTRNGLMVGTAFENVNLKTPSYFRDNPQTETSASTPNLLTKLFPCVGMRTQGETLRTNFGQCAFVFDINYYVSCKRYKTWELIRSNSLKVTHPFVDVAAMSNEADVKSDSSISNLPLKTADSTPQKYASSSTSTASTSASKIDEQIDKPVQDSNNDQLQKSSLQKHKFVDLHRMIAKYLAHYGYSETLERFIAANSSSSSLCVDSFIDTRLRVCKFIMAGKICESRQELIKNCPGLLESRPEVASELDFQIFVQLIAKGSPIDALSFAKDNINTINAHPLSKSALSLLAYNDPKTAPEAYLLDSSRLQALSSVINTCILTWRGLPGTPAIERLVSHALVLGSEAAYQVAAEVNLIDLTSNILEKPLLHRLI